MNASTLPRQMPREAFRSAWARFGVVLSGLVLVVVIILLTVWPWPYAFVARRLLLPTYESEFGFHGGAIRPPGAESSAYGIASVVPGGRLDRAGAKAGDIPVDYHLDGALSFYYALKAASQGEEGSFTVVRDWRDYPDRERRREIRLAPK
jgi:hypothetical protein